MKKIGVGIIGIDQQSKQGVLWHRFAHQFESFGAKHIHEIAYAGDISSGSIEARDQADFDRVLPNDEHDRNCAGRCLSRHSAGQGLCSDNGRPVADQIGRQTRQPVELTARPTVLENHVLAFDEAAFAQALTKGGGERLKTFGRAAPEKTYNWRRRLLRTRQHRPQCRAADYGD